MEMISNYIIETEINLTDKEKESIETVIDIITKFTNEFQKYSDTFDGYWKYRRYSFESISECSEFLKQLIDEGEFTVHS